MAERIAYDAGLVEEAVFLAMSRLAAAEPARIGDWSREREALYSLPLGPARERSFAAHARAWFDRLALGAPIDVALRACPRTVERLVAFDVRRAVRARDERSEVFGAPGARPSESNARMLLAVRAQRFLDPDSLHEFALRELYHADDVFDPAFAFDADLIERAAEDEHEVERIREGFRALWEARVDGRLSRGRDPGAKPPAAPERFVAALGRGAGRGELAELFRATWSGEIATHKALLERALARRFASVQEVRR